MVLARVIKLVPTSRHVRKPLERVPYSPEMRAHEDFTEVIFARASDRDLLEVIVIGAFIKIKVRGLKAIVTMYRSRILKVR